MPPTEDTDDLRQKLTHAEAVIVELRGVVADLRRQIDAQQAHIHRLVKMTFGRSSERANGPTLFDGLDPELDPTPICDGRVGGAAKVSFDSARRTRDR